MEDEIEVVVETPKKRTIKDRQYNRMKKFLPSVDESEIRELLDNVKDNIPELYLLATDNDVDPKKMYSKSLFSKKLIEYIENYKDELVENIDEVVEDAKEDINEILDDVKEDVMSISINQLEDIINVFVERVEELSKVLDDQKNITKKFDEMVDDMENKMVESKDDKKVEQKQKQVNARDELNKLFKLK